MGCPHFRIFQQAPVKGLFRAQDSQWAFPSWAKGDIACIGEGACVFRCVVFRQFDSGLHQGWSGKNAQRQGSRGFLAGSSNWLESISQEIVRFGNPAFRGNAALALSMASQGGFHGNICFPSQKPSVPGIDFNGQVGFAGKRQ